MMPSWLGPVEFLLLTVCPIAGFGFAGAAVRAYGPLRRIQQLHTSAVRELRSGPAELYGKIRAVSTPLKTCSDTPAVAVFTQVSCSYRQGNKTYRKGVVVEYAQAVRSELTDESGTCELTLDHFIVIGPVEHRSCSAADFSRKFPDVAGRCDESILPANVTYFRIKQTYIRNDGPCLVSGVAKEGSTSEVSEEGYRTVHPRYNMKGDDTLPLIVSAWTEKQTRGHLRHPFFWLCVASFMMFLVPFMMVFALNQVQKLSGLG